MEPLVPAYAEAACAYYARNRAHLDPWEPQRAPEFFTVAFHRRELEQTWREQLDGRCARFALHVGDGDELIGIVNLWAIRRGNIQAAVIGYSLDAAHEGHGYMTEAARAVLDYAFTALNLHRVETSYHPTNERSGRVLRRLGFVVEGYARDYLRIAGDWRDAILVSITNPNWQAD
ncbi:MAG TPA: GNAT family protein [Candidatus Sulfotelmatobacter sp.]|nr:GNAT family protein [Candidatus Sulfotelmatobacter sp.]